MNDDWIPPRLRRFWHTNPNEEPKLPEPAKQEERQQKPSRNKDDDWEHER